MILLVDAGNSRIKWRMWRQGLIHSGGELPTGSCAGLVAAWSGYQAEAACVSSVAGEEVNLAIQTGLDGVLGEKGAKSHWLAALSQGHGIVSHYQPAGSLGSDRFAALVAAHRRQRVDWVVVSVGTALTADMLTAEGEFLGGCIAPGPDLMQAALARGTARVQVHAATTAMDWPRNTQTAVGQGIAWALWGVVEGMSRQLAQAAGRPPRVLLTGGARHVLRPLLSDDVVQVDELVLEGLAWIARDLGYDA